MSLSSTVGRCGHVVLDGNALDTELSAWTLPSISSAFRVSFSRAFLSQLPQTCNPIRPWSDVVPFCFGGTATTQVHTKRMKLLKKGLGEHACRSHMSDTIMLNNYGPVHVSSSSGRTQKYPTANNMNLYMVHILRMSSLFFPSRAKKTQPLIVAHLPI